MAPVLTLVRTGRTSIAAPAVGAWIGSAYWFTSSTSVANPAVTLGRMMTDTFAGIAPASVPAFIAAQLVGTAFGIAAGAYLHAAPPAQGNVVVTQDEGPRESATRIA